jgi:hypothetical protein
MSTLEKNFAKLDPENFPFENARPYEVTIPKFKLSLTLKMKELLKNIGLTDAFDQVLVSCIFELLFYTSFDPKRGALGFFALRKIKLWEKALFLKHTRIWRSLKKI